MTPNMGGNIDDDPLNNETNVLVLDGNVDQFSEGLEGETDGQNMFSNCEDQGTMSDDQEEVNLLSHFL